MKYHDYIRKDIKDTERTRICIKSIKVEITQKVIKQELSFLYATHRHDLVYTTVKYHQNIPNGIQVIERTQKCLRMDVHVRMDGRTDDEQTPGSSLYPPNLSVGDEKSLKLFVFVKMAENMRKANGKSLKLLPFVKMVEKHKEANRKSHKLFPL